MRCDVAIHFKWFKHLVDNVITRQEKVINDLLVETKAQNEVLSDINEGLKPISQMQINSVCNNFFDLDCEKTVPAGPQCTR